MVIQPDDDTVSIAPFTDCVHWMPDTRRVRLFLLKRFVRHKSSNGHKEKKRIETLVADSADGVSNWQMHTVDARRKDKVGVPVQRVPIVSVSIACRRAGVRCV